MMTLAPGNAPSAAVAEPGVVAMLSSKYRTPSTSLTNFKRCGKPLNDRSPASTNSIFAPAASAALIAAQAFSWLNTPGICNASVPQITGILNKKCILFHVHSARRLAQRTVPVCREIVQRFAQKIHLSDDK